MNIGLVLSGGMAKGAYQIGALKAIREYLCPCDIKYTSCSSIGVLNGYAFLNDRLDVAQKLWENICSNNNRLFINTVLKGNFLPKAIKEIHSEQDCIENPFYISLLNLKEKSIVYNNLANSNPELYRKYLRASVAMPIYNSSVEINGDYYYDGAMADNIPIYPLLKHTVDYVICIYFDECCYTFENSYFDNKVIKITFPAKKTLADSLILKKSDVESMLSQGYIKTKQMLDIIFKNSVDDIEYILKTIEFLNEQQANKKMRITGDVIVTNINKVASKITKRKINL